MNRRHPYLYAAGYVFSMAATVVMNVATGRILGPGPYGVLSICRSLYQVLLLATPLGMDLGLQRQIAEGETLGRPVYRLFVFARRACLGAALLALAATAAGSGVLGEKVYHAAGLAWPLVLTVAALPFATDMAVLFAVGRVRGDLMRYTGTALVLQPLCRLALTAAAFLFWPTLPGVAAASTAGIVISWAVYNVIEHKLFDDRGGAASSPAPGERLAFAKMSLWLGASLFFYGLLRNADLLTLGLFVTKEDVGRYAAISFVAQMVQALPVAISQGLGPKVAAAHASGDTAGVRRVLGEAISQSLPVSVFLFAGVAAFGADLHVVFGQGFTISPTVAVLLAFGYFIAGVLAPIGYSLSMTGRHRIESLVIVTGGLALVAATFVGARFFGAAGAAAASCVVLLAVNLVRAGLVRKLQGFFVPEIAGVLAAVPALLLAFAVRAGTAAVVSEPFLRFALGTVGYTLLFGAAALLVLQKRFAPLMLKVRRAA